MKKLLLPVFLCWNLAYAESTESTAGALAVQAVFAGDVNRLKSLLTGEGGNVLFVDSHKNSLLHHAVIVGNTEIITLLIAQGADLSVEDMFGQTALEVAKSLGNTRIISILESFQNSSPSENPQEVTEEDNVVRVNFSSRSQLKKIQQSTQSEKEIKKNLYQAVHSLDAPRLTQLLSNIGVQFINDVFVKDNRQYKLLHLAIKEYERSIWIFRLQKRTDTELLQIKRLGKQVIETLINFGADLNAAHDKKTPLTIAIENNLIDVTNLLLDKGADPNLPSNRSSYSSLSYTLPLGIALRELNFDLALILLQRGADINFQHKSSTILTDLIIHSSQETLPAILFALKHGADPTLALATAVHLELSEVVQILLKHKANPHSTQFSDPKESILDYARKFGKNPKIVSMLESASASQCQRVLAPR